jgi:hypothetical protein
MKGATAKIIAERLTLASFARISFARYLSK